MRGFLWEDSHNTVYPPKLFVLQCYLTNKQKETEKNAYSAK